MYNAVPKKVAMSIVSLVPDEFFFPTNKELNSDGTLNEDEYVSHHRVLDISRNTGGISTV